MPNHPDSGHHENMSTRKTIGATIWSGNTARMDRTAIYSRFLSLSL